MSTFDPYYKWLAIPPVEQPPHHYRLLGVPLFDSDMDVIEAAADRQMAYVRQCATGEYVTESQKILNELSAARVCLLNPAKKKQYDDELRRRLKSPTTGSAPRSADARRGGRQSVRDDTRSGRYFDVAGWRVEPKQIAAGLCVIVALVIGVSYGAKYLSKGPAAGDGLPLRSVAVDAAPNPVVEAAKTPQPRRGFLRFTQADGVEIADTAGLLDLSGSFTLELWARWADDGQPQYLVTDEVWPGMHPSIEVPATGGWMLSNNPRGQDPGLLLTFARAAPDHWMHFRCQPAISGTGSEWRHIAVVKSPETVKIFVNGKMRASHPVDGIKFTASPTNIFLGVRRFAFVDRCFNGDICAFRLSSSARYAKNFSPPGSFTSDRDTLVLYEFRETDRNVVEDLSGNKHEGLILGAKFLPFDPGALTPEEVARDLHEQPKSVASALQKDVWSWSFNRLQDGRVPESSRAGFEIGLPTDASPDGNLASMIGGNCVEFRGGQCLEVAGAGDFGWKEPFSVAIWVRPETSSDQHGCLIAKMGDLPALQGYALEYNHGLFNVFFINNWSAPGGGTAIAAHSLGKFGVDEWRRVLMTYDGTAKFAGIALYVDGRREPLEPSDDRLTGDFRIDQRLTLGSRRRTQNFEGWLAEPRVYARALTQDEALREFQQTSIPDTSLTQKATATDGIAAQFTGRSYIEIEKSVGALDLDHDFTIEMWAKWQRPDAWDVFAGDEAWPSMSSEVPVVGERGWTLRKQRVDNARIVDFTVGSDSSWLGMTAPLPANSYAWFHIAVCRNANDVMMFLNGRRVANLSVAGKKLLNSPSPMYLGVRKYAHVDRFFEGQIRGFHASTAAKYTANFNPPVKLTKDDKTLVLFNFAGASGRTVVDESGNHRNGVLEGAKLVPSRSVEAAVANPARRDGGGETAPPPEKAPSPAAVKTPGNETRPPAAQSVRIPEKSWFATIERQAPFACSGQTNSFFADDRSLRTELTWEKSPALAAEKARAEGKLVFLIHVSGNFEDPGFT